MDPISVTAIAIGVFVLGPILWLLAGAPKLWGPERGTPFCGHPFEQAHPQQYIWRCPKCGTEFERPAGDGRWQLLRPGSQDRKGITMVDNEGIRGLLSPAERAQADVETVLSEVVADRLSRAGDGSWKGLRWSPDMPEDDDVPPIVQVDGEDDVNYEVEVIVTLTKITQTEPAGG